MDNSQCNKYMEKIIDISKYLNVMIFNISSVKKWKLKSQHEISILLNEKIHILHENLYVQIKILNQSKKFEKAIKVLKEHQYKLVCIDKLCKFIYAFNIKKICVIESFSNNEE